MDTWAELFERAGEYETSVEAIRETLASHREGNAGDESTARRGDDA